MLTAYVFHLRGLDLHIPLVYGGDVLSHAHTIKSIIDTGWVFANPWIGAPFGAVLYDYPSSESLHYLVVRFLSLFSHDPFFIYNIYYLASFPLAAITALFALRKLKLRFYVALPGAIAFAFLPFHILRYEHLFLALYYMVPLGLLGVIEAANGNSNLVAWSSQDHRLSINLRQPKIWFYALACILAASSGVYYGFFIASVGIVSAIRALFLKRAEDRLSRSVSCLLLVALLIVTTAINGAPSYLYEFVHGSPSTPTALRLPGEAEFYGLKIIQLLLPSPIGRFARLTSMTRFYDANTPLLNENQTSSLGFLAGIGFLYSLLFLLRQHRTSQLDDYLGFVNICCILIATIGGFGAIAAFLFLPQIRAYNRMSVLIGFISIAVFCRLIERLAATRQLRGLARDRRNNLFVSGGLSLALLAAVFVDQCYNSNFASNYQAAQISYRNDERFAGEVRLLLPTGAMVFELPFMLFPENGPIHQMGDYDQFRPYLLSSGLRWSYGDTKGRPSSDWNQSTAMLPVDEMMQRLAAAGFSGIYIDRFGYPDAGREIESGIRRYVTTDPIVSRDARFVFFDIRALQIPAAPHFLPMSARRRDAR
jgi:phosphoglycerol transferase